MKLIHICMSCCITNHNFSSLKQTFYYLRVPRTLESRHGWVGSSAQGLTRLKSGSDGPYSNWGAHLRKNLFLSSLRLLAKFVSLRALDSCYLLSEGCPQLAIVCLPSATCHKDLSTWPLSSNAAREKTVHQPDGLISCKTILVKLYHYLCHILLFRSISQVLLIPGGGGEWVLHNGMNTRRQG